MPYSLLKPNENGVMETVSRHPTYEEARAASQVGHDYTYAEIISSSYVEIEDGSGKTLYLITWTLDEVQKDQK